MLVIDTRQPVLPKVTRRDRNPRCLVVSVMPVLNFVRDAASRVADWHPALQEAGLHARAEFDVVAPFNGSERQLYTDLATLLPTRRQHWPASSMRWRCRRARHAGGRACWLPA